MLHGCGWRGRGVYWLEFALTICSARPGHKFTAHLICDFVSLSLSLSQQIDTTLFNLELHIHTHAFCLHKFINLRTETAPPAPAFTDHALLLFMELITKLRLRDLYSACICIFHLASYYVYYWFEHPNELCEFGLFLFWANIKSFLIELISSSNASLITLIIYKHFWAVSQWDSMGFSLWNYILIAGFTFINRQK